LYPVISVPYIARPSRVKLKLYFFLFRSATVFNNKYVQLSLRNGDVQIRSGQCKEALSCLLIHCINYLLLDRYKVECYGRTLACSLVLVLASSQVVGVPAPSVPISSLLVPSSLRRAYSVPY